VLDSDVNGRSASTRGGFYQRQNGKLCALGVTELTLENNGFFLSKLQHKLVFFVYLG
jgi:hypothetical protein